MNVHLVNENSVIVYFSDMVTTETAAVIARACQLFRTELSDCLSDIIPSYTSVLLSCHSRQVGLRTFVNRINILLKHFSIESIDFSKNNLVVLPVYYGDEVALDRMEICQHTDLSFSEIIERHTSENYRVFAIGFSPGFAYLGNTNEQLKVPRKKNPRASVPKGSVALADQQTAVYPSESPGGWQIVGRTPLDLFNKGAGSLSHFEMGDEVRFESISRDTFLELGGTL